MAINLSSLANEPRLLIESELRPVQGHRFQPTGFPDLGPARYDAPDGTPMVLLESVQSVANRLEETCWDHGTGALVPALDGLPYVSVLSADGKELTNSLLESHRLNSPYILEGEDRSVFSILQAKLGTLEKGPVDNRLLARTLFGIDPNSVLHGVFLAKKELAGGRLRLARVLSGFVEASGVRPAESGGVKNDRVDPQGDTKQGFGNVPFHRVEFTAEHITASFNLDLALLRSYGLPTEAFDLLVTLAMYKVRRFLRVGLRLRTACDLDPVDGVRCTRPQGFVLPEELALEKAVQELVAACRARELFAATPVIRVAWKPTAKKAAAKADDGDDSDGGNA